MRLMLLALAAALAPMGAPARAEWREATSDHLIVYADADEPTVRAFAERLERFDAAQRALRRLASEGSTDNKLTVYAVRNLRAIDALAGAGAGYVLGWYDPKAEASYMVVPLETERAAMLDHNFSTTIVLLHEYTHHLFFRSVPGAFPVWFSEGTAEFFSTAEFALDGAVTFGLPATHRAYELGNLKIRAQDLLTKGQAWSGPGVYGKGWLLVHYLTFAPQRAGQLDRYLSAVGSGTAAPTAAASAFGDLARLEAETNVYLRQRTLPTVRIAPERIKIGAIQVRTLTTAEQAMMPIRIGMLRLDGRGAHALADRAVRLSAGTEQSARAQTILAEALLAAADLDHATAAAERAIAADSRDPAALFVRARIATARAAATPQPARGVAWAEARRRIVAANRADPDAPGPLAAYYASFVAAGDAPSAAAQNGLKRALVLAPESPRLRLLAVRQAVRDGNWKEARTYLAFLAYDPHLTASAKAATAMIALIDGGKTADLPAALDTAFAGIDPENER